MGFRYIPASAGPETYGVLGGLRGIAGAAGGGSVNFDFTTGSLPGAITFTRASIGTYFNSSNILTIAGNDVARMNYVSGVSCLLIEGSATNILVQSNNFGVAPWYSPDGLTMTPAAFVSPDGTSNGWSAASPAGASGSAQQDNYSLPFVPYTWSMWAKRIVGSSVTRFVLPLVGGTQIPTPVTIARVSDIMTANTATGYIAIQVLFNASTNGWYGAQLEAGSKMTSYIPTTTTAVTRAADNAVFTIPTGINTLTYTFDDGSTQVVSVSPGSYTIPSNLNRPNIKSIVGSFVPPGVNFDFTSGVLPGAITFTRPSIGTYNSSGNILTTASSNVARFNYVGGVSNLLIEPAATNLLIQSNNFPSWTGSPSNSPVLTAAQFVSPDGTTNGWTMTSGTGNAYIDDWPIAYSAVPYTMSIWSKWIGAASNWEAVQIDGAAQGYLVPTATLTRRSATATPSAGTASILFVILAPAGETHGIYGAQLETGSVMTSYIPTTTAAVTRAADSAVFTVPSGVGHLTYTFDDNTTQLVTVSAGSYTIPTTLNRPNIKSIVGSA